ncbi:MAG: hypothetical protein ACQCN4_08350 [Candidatus Bathyarchaeia archaeon]|jgi:hypothetical protein
MKFASKFIAAAIFSLCIGVAVATPLFATEIIPYPRMPQGPKAEFGVNVAYTDFKIADQPDEYGRQQMQYNVVLNVTNLADIEAKLGTVNFAAAQNITILKGAMEGGTSSSSGGGSGSNSFGGRIEGLWLDDKWLNVTWIPGTHPEGLVKVMTPPWGSGATVHYVSSLPTAIPNLPENASENGYWIEGVPIKQYQYFNSTENKLTLYDTIYANGTWVNVTGRIRIEDPKESVLSFGTIIQTSTMFWPRSTSIGTLSNSTNSQNFVIWSGDGDFNNTWMPHQSRLIQVKGTTYVGSNEIPSLTASEKINLYAAAYSYIWDQPVNGTFYDTSKISTSLTAVHLTETSEGNYIYNLLSGSQTFQTDQYGEVFLKQES